ncbi:bisanhydrobacterioruberin hydratase [Natronorubrum bangense]|uniref:Carotene biosynthesis associated membrane protein n=2 Tax=Natronorubrum bangense TaxID=61858 RepID=L9WR77_9EURY|nr:bisanhydrobacterioruberin hydratase [Natronorubrum bangense]ELY51984.1 carotene biosynthesis associated membrane protein [Natronorubrum bangense JCM 10635]QCC54802.1 carotenoid biosynthesis protein [Natronorubrum bangense]
MANHDSQLRTDTTRTTVQRRLEAIIRENRFTIAVVFPVIGAVTLVASAEGLLPEPLAYNPLLILFGTMVMRSPLVVGLLPKIGWWALGLLGLLTAYTYAIEIVGVRTDWPYGAFEYTIQLGPMLFGDVPLALPLFFIPLVLNAYLLTLLVLGEWSENPLIRVLSAIVAVVAIDLVLDPAAVAIGFWEFNPAGVYYGVPVSNYVGWVISGTVAVVLVDLAFDRESLLERVRECEFILDDLVSFVLLWGAINVLYSNWLAAGVAGLFCLGLFQTDRYDRDLIRQALPSSGLSGRES